MGALETLQAKYECQMLFVESGGDNLAANYSRELADYIIYVIDVSVRSYLERLVPTNIWVELENREEIRFHAKVVLVSLNQICLSSTR